MCEISENVLRPLKGNSFLFSGLEIIADTMKFSATLKRYCFLLFCGWFLQENRHIPIRQCVRKEPI